MPVMLYPWSVIAELLVLERVVEALSVMTNDHASCPGLGHISLILF